MLRILREPALEAFIDKVVPPSIRMRRPLQLDEPLGESAVLERLKEIAGKNTVYRSLIGMGYYDTITRQ